jgi:hypothetical protein
MMMKLATGANFTYAHFLLQSASGHSFMLFSFTNKATPNFTSKLGVRRQFRMQVFLDEYFESLWLPPAGLG